MKRLIVILSILTIGLQMMAQEPSVKKIRKQADADFELQHYPEAIAGYTKVNELKPYTFDVLYNRAVCYEKTNKLSEAISDYNACINLETKEKDIYLKIADLQMLLNDYKSANAVLEKLLAIDKSNVEGLRKSAWSHIILKEFEQAVSKADRAIDKETNTDGQGTEIAHYYRGLAKDSLKDYNAAIASYKRAIIIFKLREVNRLKAKPHYKPYYSNVATAEYKAKQYDEAIKHYDIAIATDQPDTVLPKNYYVYYLKSFPFFAKNDFNSAIGELNRAIVLNNNSDILFFQRAVIYKQTSQYQSAISDFTKAILLNDTNARAYYYRAECYMELGNFKEAISSLKLCLKINTKNTGAVALLKDAEEKNYIANKESDPPSIKWEYPFIDQNNFINVYVNQVNVLLESQITDKSLIKSITVNGKDVKFNNETLNPDLKYKLTTEGLKRIEVAVTDIYNNTSTKTIKVGKIVSETKTIVNLEGIILANDNSGNPIANKTILITNQKGEVFYSGKTSDKGYFKFENLPIDKDYLIEIEDESMEFKNSGFILADKNGKHIMKSVASSKEKNKFCFELLQTDMSTLSLMTVDELPLMINIKGKLMGLETNQFPLPGITFELIKDNGESISRTTDDNGAFNFANLNPHENYTFKISQEEAKKINASKVIIMDYKGQVIKIISKNENGFFEYKILSVEKSQLSEISEPDPWLKTMTLNPNKKELTIIENIYYESGSFLIPKVSETILDKAIEALKANPKVILEVESHTDAVASDEYNMDLSQKRALKVVEYIKTKGIDEKRLVARGMGETQLSNQCANGVDCSDAEHKQNRRTIFKLIYQ